MPKLIGAGWYGIVIQPGFDCSTGNFLHDTSTIGKIAKKKELVKEYDFIKKLPQGKNKPYIKKEDVKLCEISEDIKENIKKNFKTLLDNSEEYNSEEYNELQGVIEDIDFFLEWQLTMPNLGIDFGKYLEKYKSQVIPIDEFLDIMNALNYLSDEIKLLNDDEIFHLDIKTNNLIYNEKKKKFLLIDFNISYNEKSIETHVNKRKNYYFDDKMKIVNIFIKIIEYGMKNNGIYNSYISDGIDTTQYFSDTTVLQEYFQETEIKNNLDLLYKYSFDMSIIYNKFLFLEIDEVEKLFDNIYKYFLDTNKIIIKKITGIIRSTNETILPLYKLPDFKIKAEKEKVLAKRFSQLKGGKTRYNKKRKTKKSKTFKRK